MDTSITIDTEINHHNKLQNANRAMDDLLGSASSIIGSISKQGVTLKVAKFHCGSYNKCVVCSDTKIVYNQLLYLSYFTVPLLYNPLATV